MNTGLLQAVRKYRPRDNLDPLENFITEAFCWVLTYDQEFAQKFVIDIAEKTHLTNFDVSNCEWSTQNNFNGVFPDMVCVSNNCAIVFEHKVWSEVHSNQIEKYRSYASNHFDQYSIALITASEFQHSIADQNNKPDISLCWRDIYSLISDTAESNKSEYCPKADFKALLRSEGLGPAAPITQESMRYYFATDSLERNLSNLVKRVSAGQWHNSFSEALPVHIEQTRNHLFAERWGRIGMAFKGGRPDLYIGFILNQVDIGVLVADKTKGPDLSLLITFDKTSFSEQTKTESYKYLMERLNVKLKQEFDDGWELCIHDTVQSSHHGVPARIRKPMFEVFADCITTEDQDRKFIETATKLINLVVTEESFWTLREECSTLDTNKAA